MRRLSLSTLGHARICPGSAVLPGFDSVAGAPGSAIHDGASARVRYGARDMIATLPDICERWNLNEVETAIVIARLRSWQPAIPDGALSEIPLGLFDDGSVRVVRGGRGEYEWMPGLILPGTIDLVWSEAEPLELQWCESCGGSGTVRLGDPEWSEFQQTIECGACHGHPIAARCPAGSVAHVAEIKSGAEANVPRVLSNWQEKGAALLFARWTGATDVAPHTCFVAPGEGRWDDPEVALDAADLDRIDAEIRRVASEVDEQQQRLKAGKPLRLVTGPHCTYCKARAGCPAQLAEVRNLIIQRRSFDLSHISPGALTDHEAQSIAAMLPRAESVVRQARKALQAHADAFGPIALDDGRQWGLHDTGKQNTVWDPITTFNVLCEDPTVGHEFAGAALSTSEKSVKAAIENAHESAGIQRKVAPTKRAVYAEVAKQGGITKRPKYCYGTHHPDQAVRALPEAIDVDEAAGENWNGD